jgi:hypothetical protein
MDPCDRSANRTSERVQIPRWCRGEKIDATGSREKASDDAEALNSLVGHLRAEPNRPCHDTAPPIPIMGPAVIAMPVMPASITMAVVYSSPVRLRWSGVMTPTVPDLDQVGFKLHLVQSRSSGRNGPR